MEKSSYTMKKSNGWSMQLISISGKLNVLAFGVILQDTWIKSILNMDFLHHLRAKSVDSRQKCGWLLHRVAILNLKSTCESHKQYEFLQINTLY